jgi:predicted metal-binding membrane protein
MMAAMMLPSVAPTIALFARLAGPKSRLAPWLFVGGYLLAWMIAGLLAYGVGMLATMTLGEALRWDHQGRALAAATLGLAAVYELSPLKDVCLGTCRSPLGALLGSWRDGLAGALRMGARNGAWCVGCCWALMASLFALGLMSLSWMALVAALIAVEKTLPWRRVTLAVAAALALLGILLLTAPDALPWLTIPGATM